MNETASTAAEAGLSPVKRRARTVIRRGFLTIAAIYLLLLIPSPEPYFPAGAGRQPFAWNQNAYWSELERRFLQARTDTADARVAAITKGLASTTDLLDQITSRPMPPDATEFRDLETRLFELAPRVAASPATLPQYVALATRMRSVVKRQSERWDMNSTAVRARLYRWLYGGRAALEEIMIQAAAYTNVSDLVLADQESSATPSVQVRGVSLHSGDILVSRGGAPTSALIARGNDFPGNFSHIALLYVDATNHRATVIESHIESGVVPASIDEYFNDKKLRIVLLRPRADLPGLVADPLLPHRAAYAALADANRRHIPYDFALDFQHHEKQFCSEVAAAAYEAVGLRLWMGLSSISSPTVVAWLASLGVRHFETQEPSDLEYDPQLRVVAEWRDPATLFKAHVDDAVTDLLLETGPVGQPLPYPIWLLPVARVQKGVSLVLNLAGKSGPIPEGMTAAAALRVRSYRMKHSALAARVYALAEEFKASHGYSPPYWELVRLAREARNGR